MADSAPELVLARPAPSCPRRGDAAAPRRRPRRRAAATSRREPDDEAPALVVYTSGTTGPPKGVVLPRRAIASNLDALADAVGVDGRRRGRARAAAVPRPRARPRHARPAPARRHGAPPRALLVRGGRRRRSTDGATMLFARADDVPPARPATPRTTPASPTRSGGRACWSPGRPRCPAAEHERIERLTGQRVVERYGMTETLMNTVDPRRRRAPARATSGRRCDGVELRLVDDDGDTLETPTTRRSARSTVRGPEPLPRVPEPPRRDRRGVPPTAGSSTGDLATRAPDGYIRIVGRRATDLIKSGGFKIGAGEIEGALLEHPAVAEVAVTGEPDPDLGERIVAWVVAVDGRRRPAATSSPTTSPACSTPHKRPRVVRFVDELPRNAMGKVQKARLGG